jgi:hypothetical protein
VRKLEQEWENISTADGKYLHIITNFAEKVNNISNIGNYERGN